MQLSIDKVSFANAKIRSRSDPVKMKVVVRKEINGVIYSQLEEVEFTPENYCTIGNIDYLLVEDENESQGYMHNFSLVKSSCGYREKNF